MIDRIDKLLSWQGIRIFKCLFPPSALIGTTDFKYLPQYCAVVLHLAHSRALPAISGGGFPHSAAVLSFAAVTRNPLSFLDLLHLILPTGRQRGMPWNAQSATSTILMIAVSVESAVLSFRPVAPLVVS